MRQIEGIAAMLGWLIFGKNGKTVSLETDSPGHARDGDLFAELSALLKQGNYCGAEDRLFEALETGEPDGLRTALRFYSALNQISEAELRQGNYSREEILDGLREACLLCGVDRELFAAAAGEEPGWWTDRDDRGREAP